MERKEAIALGLSKFETGRPCFNGHIAYRYTESGACSECVNPKTKAAKSDLTTIIKVRVFDSDIDKLNEIVMFACGMRNLNLSMFDVTCHGKSKSHVNDTSLRFYCVHKDDASSLQDVAYNMFNATSASRFDYEAALNKVLNSEIR